MAVLANDTAVSARSRPCRKCRAGGRVQPLHAAGIGAGRVG
jgi:hypothetical protein